MAHELVARGEGSPNDYCIVIQAGRGEKAKVLGRVNTINGVFVPPDLKERVAKYHTQSKDIAEVMKHAEHPVNRDYKFKFFRDKIKYDPNSSMA